MKFTVPWKGSTRDRDEKVSIFLYDLTMMLMTISQRVWKINPLYLKDRSTIAFLLWADVGREERRAFGWHRMGCRREVGAGVAHIHLRSSVPWAFALSTGWGGTAPEITELDGLGMGRRAWARAAPARGVRLGGPAGLCPGSQRARTLASTRLGGVLDVLQDPWWLLRVWLSGCITQNRVITCQKLLQPSLTWCFCRVHLKIRN